MEHLRHHKAWEKVRQAKSQLYRAKARMELHEEKPIDPEVRELLRDSVERWCWEVSVLLEAAWNLQWRDEYGRPLEDFAEQYLLESRTRVNKWPCPKCCIWNLASNKKCIWPGCDHPRPSLAQLLNYKEEGK